MCNRDLSFAGFTPDQFLEMCVMSGCDYLPSLPGVGIKRAHGLLRRFRSYSKALRNLRFEAGLDRFCSPLATSFTSFQMDYARHVIHIISNPGFVSRVPPCDVASRVLGFFGFGHPKP